MNDHESYPSSALYFIIDERKFVFQLPTFLFHNDAHFVLDEGNQTRCGDMKQWHDDVHSGRFDIIIEKKSEIR